MIKSTQKLAFSRSFVWFDSFTRGFALKPSPYMPAHGFSSLKWWRFPEKYFLSIKMLPDPSTAPNTSVPQAAAMPRSTTTHETHK